MPLDRFLIAPEEVGMENDLKPWLIPDTGYEQLFNAYLYRGRIRKRFGSRYMTTNTAPNPGFEQLQSRLRVKLGVIGDPQPFVIPNSTPTILAIGQIFSVDDVIFTINALGNVITLSTDPAFSATINTTVNPNTVTISAGFPAGTPVYWYPSLPVMGLIIWQSDTINNEPTIAFDTRFAYQYNVLGTGWERLQLGVSTWSGSDSQFFWGYTYRGTSLADNNLYVTNFKFNAPADTMRYLDKNLLWNVFSPKTATAPGNNIITARIIVGFNGHMILLNTFETNTVASAAGNFQNRARYSAIGSPLDDIPNNFFPWVDNINDPNFRGGGFVDNLATQEAIVSAEFIYNRLIVYFERSTWELAYTANQQQPFQWLQINTEFGAQSTFSKVPFDTEVLAIAQNGITQCTGNNVSRIDYKIPQDVFKIRNTNDGVKRVAGIRDYFVEQTYWAIPNSGSATLNKNDIYPNQVIVYNYAQKTWAYNTDSFTAFGYFTKTTAQTWGSTTTQWQNMTSTWGSGDTQSNFRNIIAGNQEGYVVYIDPNITRNVGMIQITNMVSLGNTIVVTAINHNLSNLDLNTNQDEYIYFENVFSTAVGPGTFSSLNGGIFPIISITDYNTFVVAAFPIFDTYIGGGTVARVSNINILSKQWNPYNKQGQNVFIQKINFLVDRTGGVDNNGVPYGGEVTVDYYPSTSKYSILNNAPFGQLISNGALETKPYPPTFYPLEEFQDRVWHPQYLAVDGNAIQIRIFMNDFQIVQPEIAFSDFVLHGVILEAMPTSVRIGG